MWEIVVALIGGILLGYILTKIRQRSIGNLICVDDPDEGAYMFLELTRGSPEDIKKKRQVIFCVVTRNAQK